MFRKRNNLKFTNSDCNNYINRNPPGKDSPKAA